MNNEEQKQGPKKLRSEISGNLGSMVSRLDNSQEEAAKINGPIDGKSNAFRQTLQVCDFGLQTAVGSQTSSGTRVRLLTCEETCGSSTGHRSSSVGK
ncbi:hypothetical protein RvY_15972 [Ramazzottius varieornatus]|uniref:Uncharacterized protein n=1 Tax=Ramazzottius varieornatus TaxID=947166 RepID=A0A1D1VY79_RAMVA|nr:hypothetical protein RvY_15972 [Ramazzottius varieornatus]